MNCSSSCRCVSYVSLDVLLLILRNYSNKYIVTVPFIKTCEGHETTVWHLSKQEKKQVDKQTNKTKRHADRGSLF